MLRAETVYTVKAGDTLGAIAQEYGVTVRALKQHNQMGGSDRILEGQTLAIPPGSDVPIRYAVKAGDTLGVIARDYGVHPSDLVELNELNDPDTLRVGQEILIPGSAREHRAGLPPDLRRQLDTIRVRPGWTHIVIHHSATPHGSMENMDRYHREHRRMVNGLGYHFVIGNGKGMGNGEITIGPRWPRQQDGGHLSSAAQNRYSIGICLVGNFEQTHPTRSQMESLRALVRYLQRRCNIRVDDVTTHTLINVRPTRCPGRNFPLEAFRRSL